MKDHKNSIIPHASRIFNTGHHLWPNRSSVVTKQVISHISNKCTQVANETTSKEYLQINSHYPNRLTQ